MRRDRGQAWLASPTEQPRFGLIDYLWTGEVALALLGPEPCGRLSQSPLWKGVVGRFCFFLFFFLNLLAGGVVFLCIY